MAELSKGHTDANLRVADACNVIYATTPTRMNVDLSVIPVMLRHFAVLKCVFYLPTPVSRNIGDERRVIAYFVSGMALRLVP